MTTQAFRAAAARMPRRGNLQIVLAAAMAVCVVQAANGQVRSFMAADGDQGAAPTTGNTSVILLPNQTISVGVWLEDTSAPGDLLGGYQPVFFDAAVPQPPAMGTVTYVDNNPGGGGGDSVFVDTGRADWVLIGQPVLAPNYLENSGLGIFGVFYGTSLGLGADPAGIGGILYLAEFQLTASADACGVFEFSFKTEQGSPPSPRTAFFDDFGGQYFVDELQNLDVIVPCECLDAGDCDDMDNCTNDTCVDFMCINDDVDCSGLDDQCLVGVCNPADGSCEAQNANEGGGCSDGLNCTENDTCGGGVCAGTAVDCSDGSACTDDVCDPADGSCSNPQSVFCDDNDVCNGLETCDPGDGSCIPGTDLVCDDGVFCNGAEICDAINGCQDGPPACLPGEICDEGGMQCLQCVETADCADLDGDGIRDDGCVWWACEVAGCVATDIIYADLGGEFGACPPDDTTDANDRFHALNCFSNQDTTGVPGEIYPCEVSPPAAYNVDAAGLGEPCSPDGVCDGNDAFAALNAFENNTTCTCGPAPQFGGAQAVVVGMTDLVAEVRQNAITPGSTVAVDVFVDRALDDLRGYQLHVGAQGGKDGELRLVDVLIEDRKDAAFAGLGAWRAFNVQTGQMLAGLDSPGVNVMAGSYLATFIFEASADAAGSFTVEVLSDTRDDSHRTVLFPTTFNGSIAVQSSSAASVSIDSKTRARRRR